ncbi:hypothetical protein RN49_13850 [Pantoea agglomerans]|nr:hypothetical protein RN49_13850 [Pantoea agglomerans]
MYRNGFRNKTINDFIANIFRKSCFFRIDRLNFFQKFLFFHLKIIEVIIMQGFIDIVFNQRIQNTQISVYERLC